MHSSNWVHSRSATQYLGRLLGLLAPWGESSGIPSELRHRSKYALRYCQLVVCDAMLSARGQPHHLNREQPTAGRLAKGRNQSRPSNSRFVCWRTPVCSRRSQAHTSYFGPERRGSVSSSRPTMRVQRCRRQDVPRRPGVDAPVCPGKVDLRLDVLGVAGVAIIGQWTLVSIDPL